MIDIVRWAESPIGFYVDRSWCDGAWVLKDAPIRLAPYHADILSHIFTPDDDGRLPYDTIGWCEPAKSGKSAIAGLVAQYAGLHLEQNSAVVLASNKQNQAASIMYASFADSVRMNPALDFEPGRYETRFDNGNVCRAIASNSRGAAGARFSLAVFDELWGYVHTDAERLWTEFKTDPTRRVSLRFAIGYAGYLESALWLDLLNSGKAGQPVPELEHIADDGDPCCFANGRTFVFWSHSTRQPWQTEQWVAEQRRTLRPAEFRRMIKTEFVEGVGDFVDPDTWEALIDPTHKPLEPGSDRPVYVGLDVAVKPKGDDCAIVGVYPEDGLVKLAFHRVWKGGKHRRQQLRLSGTVEPYILGLAKQYRIAGVYFDPRFAVQLAENLQRAGVRCIEIPQTHATRAPKDTTLYEMAVSGELVLYDDLEVRAMASHASAKELGNGLVFITKGNRGKIDALIALSNCVNEARYHLPPAGVTIEVHPSQYRNTDRHGIIFRDRGRIVPMRGRR